MVCCFVFIKEPIKWKFLRSIDVFCNLLSLKGETGFTFQKLLIHGDSATAVETLIPKTSVILWRVVYCYPCSKEYFYDCLFLCQVWKLLLTGVQGSIYVRLCNIMQYSNCFRSIAIDSWNCDDIGSDTHDLGSEFLYFLDVLINFCDIFYFSL